MALSGLVHGYARKLEKARMINAFHLQIAALYPAVEYRGTRGAHIRQICVARERGRAPQEIFASTLRILAAWCEHALRAVGFCPPTARLRLRRPRAAPTLGRDRPNRPFGVRARRRGWASALRAGERLTTLTSPPLDQKYVRARAPPVSRPPRLAHWTFYWRMVRRMAAKAPRGAMGIL